jgi:threonine aldolase
MGNQLAILSQASPGSEILVEETSHIFLNEAASHAIIAGVQTRPLPGERGAVDPQMVHAAIRLPDDSLHTSLLCIGNTHNRAGGAMPQAGIIAAPAFVALTTMIDRLAEDHENARQLAEGLGQMPGIVIDLQTVQTNIVMANIRGAAKEARELIQDLKKEGVLVSEFGLGVFRFVTHKDISANDIDKTLTRFARIL